MPVIITLSPVRFGHELDFAGILQLDEQIVQRRRAAFIGKNRSPEWFRSLRGGRGRPFSTMLMTIFTVSFSGCFFLVTYSINFAVVFCILRYAGK